jgi:predicted Zn-dependent peptidase
MNDPYTLHKLDNGLQVVIEEMPDVRSAAAGFLARTGARDEVRDLAGVSHFLEHMMFKGTAKRTWREITVDFDRLGGSYNAFTSEDRTFYYGWVRHADIGHQIELLADMMRSIVPEGEFNTEKGVILEEIAQYKDHLTSVAYEFIQEKVFAGHSLAWPILGYQETVSSLSRDRMWAYFQERYAPDNLMLIVAGKVDPAEIIGFAERYCGDWQPSGTRTDRKPPEIHGGTDVLQVDKFKQQIVALTFPSVGATHRWHETASAAATILGGDNSRFFWNIMQAGISPHTSAYAVPYEDCGVLILFGACEPVNAEKLHAAMRREADLICRAKVRQAEVDRVKNKRRTSLAVEAEAPYERLRQLMEDMDYRGAPRTVEQMLADVDAVTADTITEYFERYPVNVHGHFASVGPRAWPPA